MASYEPQVYGPDGVLRQEVVFSTTLDYRFTTGTVPTDAVDVQVSINGSGWSSDPSLVDWGDGAWTVPNSSSEPDGLLLLPGDNQILVRAILPSGATTPSASATIKRVSDSDLGVVASPPTNISLEQNNDSVTISAEPSSEDGFQGLNFYAAINAGGGSASYTRVNVELVSTGTLAQDEEDFGALEVTPDILVDAEGDPVADPMFYRLTGAQEDENETVLQSDFDETFEIPETARSLKIITTLSSVREYTVYAFEHNRLGTSASTPATVQVGSFAALSYESPLYYVVTSVYYDADQNLEFESSYSEEVSGHPIAVTTALGAFPTVSRGDIVEQYIGAIFRTNPQIKVETGSILRDTVIDPFSSEAERLRFALDFFHRARTPALLLQIDDPDSSGTSIAVSQSPYKQALKAAFFLESDEDVQNLIDSAFEAWARGFGKNRRGGIASATEATFWTTRRPTQTVPIPLGTIASGGGIQFATTKAASIPFERLASFYNPTTGRYQVTVPVKALITGSSTNVGVGQITSVVSKLPGSMSAINTAAAVGGQDEESNLALVVRVGNALASVDSGTSRGYLQTAADVAGVVKANVVAAGGDLMQRDLDDAGVHKGGKVDVWVQGENLATVTDSFAFSYEIGQDIQFEIIGTPSDYKFQAVDSNLSSDNPIIEMLDYPSAGYEFRNASTGQVFDLTDVVITSYNTIQLSTSVVQPAVDLTDVVLGSYRRRSSNVFVFPRQPVAEVTSVEGTVSGDIPSDNYLLVHPDSPLENGRSTLSQDQLEITSYVDEDGDTVPSGDLISVSDEEHVLIGQYPEFLDNLGASYLTVVVTDSTGLTTYKGPDDPSGSPDYTISLGTQTTALSITRVDSGNITSGETVLVSYDHDENFTVTYTTNLIVSLTQDAIDEKKHATADVIVKDAIPIPLDIQATVILIRGREPSTVDQALRTNTENFFSNLRLGDPVRQSDIVNVIEKTVGVSYVEVPLSLMVPAEEASIIREDISTDIASESTLLTTYSTNNASVYLLNNSLLFATTDGGGPDGSFKAVFEDDDALTLLEAPANLTALGVESGRAYILGSDGRSIPGFSDDLTLFSQGYVTSTAITARRKEITANRVLVSVPVGSAPISFLYACTYAVGEDEGAKNVDPNSAQYASVGELLFTYDEDR
jgi:uncharacterized phage protein gp47/JayE